MSDDANTEFTPEEVLSQAQAVATSWVLTTIGYLKERGLAPEEYVAYHGRHLAPAWEELRGQPVVEVAQLVALNDIPEPPTDRIEEGSRFLYVGEVTASLEDHQIRVGDTLVHDLGS